ncbi:MAG: type-F conjugative transfer system pilin assembly protein TrbC [Desulfuromonadaceae bacterium]
MRRLWHKLTIATVTLSVPALAIGSVASPPPAFIDTPDACFQIERQEGDSVYLKAVGTCDGKPGRAYIKSKSDTVKIYAEGSLWKEMKPQPLSIPDIEVSLKKGDDLAKSITIPTNSSAEKMKEAAQKTGSVFQSPEFQGRLKAETERIKHELFGGAVEQYYPDIDNAVLSQGKLGPEERIYVFVSASMPLQTIRNYAASIAKYGDSRIMMVLRGFVGGVGKIQPTIDLVGRVMQRDLSCNPVTDGECEILAVPFGVDPLLFRRYDIDRVPAVVYARGIKTEDTGLSEGDDKNAVIGEYWKAFGDASLEYIVEQMQRESGSERLLKLTSS